ncbi:MAG: hypothetical protein EPN72_05725 [Nevskiaceae bacterium]|nr:MAG: hypothetical protein EPN63_03470 [Nevskiaceae bacterium]TBR73634.1 MAG: hypothetical protein EPN72_05725 [Nevskiaceae bacterium]
MVQDTRLLLVNHILAPWRPQIGADYDAYHNHVCRMLSFCFELHPCDEETTHKACIAGAFHDLGVWSDHTLDYLPPSARLAQDYLAREGLSDWAEEITLMITEHHKLRKVRDTRYPLVEAFRRADLVDVSLGLYRGGIERQRVRDIKAGLPNCGFHKRLGQLAAGWFPHHPLRPLPFLKW